MRSLQYNVPNLVIPSATPSLTDAAQYVIINGQVSHNFCGPFSVCWAAQEETGIDNTDEFLLYIKEKDPAFAASIFPNGVARATYLYELEYMLELCGHPVPCKQFADVKIDPPTIQAMLKDFQLIPNVQIDSTGYFVGSATGHWEVLDSLRIMDSNHAILDFYNPYNNLREPYTWREFMTTTGSYKNGLWVQRDFTNVVPIEPTLLA